MTKAAELAKMGEVLTNSQIGGRRNLIINGAMQVAQRGTSETSVSTSDFFSLDRYRIAYQDSSSAFTISQDTNAPEGFKTSYKIQCTTADTSLSSTSQVGVLQRIEAQDLQQLKYGLSSAEKVTLSFYVKSNTTGTYAVNLYSQDGNRIIGTTYSISSADTWEQKILTFDGDTSGTINNDTGRGIEVKWFISAGSGFTSSDNTSWGTYADAKIAYGHAVDLADSTSDNWAITGVQLEVGEQATPFEHRSFGEELALCHRYFIKDDTDYRAYTNHESDSGSRAGNFHFPTIMRNTPSMTASVDAGSITFQNRTTHGVAMTIGGSVGTNTKFTSYEADAEL